MSKASRQKRRDNRKEKRETKKAEGKTIGQKIKKKAQATKVKAMKVLFRPFVPIAKTFLKRRGITPSNDIDTLIKQMFNEQTKKSFAYAPEDFEPEDVFDYGYLEGEAGMVEQLAAQYGLNGTDVAAAGGSAVITASTGVPVSPEMIKAVIDLLKNTLDKIKKKKANGEPLSADEQAIAGQIESIESDLDDAKKKAADISDEKKFNPMIILAILVLVVLFIFFRSK